ncbi:transposase [Streptomyces sp. NPDC087659]|uniref:transposase n=1 Tax=Streptomyces sp. NPDC087659 TaxID=3365801 RepID=UPI0038081B0A
MRVRDHLAEVFDDALFAGAFPGCGAPAQSPALLALVTVLQFTENLTDRQAAEAARDRLSWKYALGAELSDTGFDFCALSRFRARLAGGGMERVLFDRLLEHCREAGLVKAGGKQRTDSTHVISAVRDLNRTELAGESVRAALEALAVAAPSWLAGVIDIAEFAERYGPRVDGWTMPSSKTKRERLAQIFGQDALALCRAAWSPGAPRRPCSGAAPRSGRPKADREVLHEVARPGIPAGSSSPRCCRGGRSPTRRPRSPAPH